MLLKSNFGLGTRSAMAGGHADKGTDLFRKIMESCFSGEKWTGRAYKGVKKENISNFRWDILYILGPGHFDIKVCVYVCAFNEKTCFLGFSTQNHAESYGNYVKKSFLNPKCAKFNRIYKLDTNQTCQGRQVLVNWMGFNLPSQKLCLCFLIMQLLHV